MNTRRTLARAAVATRVTIARESPTAPHALAGHTLEAVLVPWNAEAEVTDDGRTGYREMWEPGSLVAAGDTVPVYGSHVQTARGLERGPLVGVARNLTEAADGLHGVIHLATDEGRRIHELAALGVRAAVSIEADVADGDQIADDTGLVVRSAARPATLTGLAVILPPQSPAYAGAVVTAVRAAPEPPEEDEELDEDGNPIRRDENGNIIPPAPPAEGGEATGRAAIAELVRTEVARFGLARNERRAVHPLARFHNPVELLVAMRQAPRAEAEAIGRAFTEAYHQHRELARVLADQITPNNPGVMPPTWLSTIFGIVDTGRPGITAMGGPASAGDTGLDIYWPYYDGDLTTLVGEQITQKTEITSVVVSFKRGQATLKTYAGGSDVSYQLQRRSSPSYLEAYNRLLQTSYALITEMVFDAALVAGAGATVVYDPASADADGALLKAALFSASAKVKKATGRPADAVLAASDMFQAIGSKPWLQPPQYGTQNVPGTTSASTLRINVSGLEIVEAPGMAPGDMIISNSDAARWYEDGPFLVSAEDVAKLGTDAAIWGMGITGITVPLGVVKTSPTIAAATAFDKSRAKATEAA